MLRIAILSCDNFSSPVLEKHGDMDDQFKTFLALGLPQSNNNGGSSTNNITIQTLTFDALKGELPSNKEGIALIQRHDPDLVVNNAFDPLDYFDGYIVTGSKYDSYSQAPEDRKWMDPLEEEIRTLDRRQKKIFGVCFGHQIAARALGGKVEQVGWNLSHNVLTVDDKFKQRIQLASDTLNFLCVHQDQVTVVPPECQVWCSNEKVKVHGLVKGDHLLTIQSHPEFSADLVRDLFDKKQSFIPDSILEPALATLDRPTDNKFFAQYVVQFFLLASQTKHASAGVKSETTAHVY